MGIARWRCMSGLWQASSEFSRNIFNCQLFCLSLWEAFRPTTCPHFLPTHWIHFLQKLNAYFRGGICSLWRDQHKGRRTELTKSLLPNIPLRSRNCWKFSQAKRNLETRFLGILKQPIAVRWMSLTTVTYVDGCNASYSQFTPHLWRLHDVCGD